MGFSPETRAVRLFSKHVEEFMPIVYDPTIAPDIEHSQRYVDPQYACFLSVDRPRDLETSLNAAAGRPDCRHRRRNILGIELGHARCRDFVVKLTVTAAAGVD